MAASSDRQLPECYRAGIIGLGFIGGGDQVSGDAIGGQQVSDLDGTHAAALAGHPRVQLVAGSSRDPGRRSRFTERTGIKTYRDWQAMLDAEALDIVSVATYAHVHRQITEAAVAAGARAVYVEKPIAQSVADAAAMCAVCAEAKVLLAVNHNRRYNPNYMRLHSAIEAGKLGDLTSLSLRWGGGRLGNVGTHLIDAACMVTGRRLAAVSASLDPGAKPDCRGAQFRDPGGWGLLRFEGGLMMTLDAADFAAGPAQLIVNGTLGRAITGADSVAIEMWSGQTQQWPSRRAEATGMDRAVGHIVEWLDAGDPAQWFPHPPEQAVAVLETIAAMHASARRQASWVELPLSGADREIIVNSG